jgi:hypothetical protein
MDIWRLKGDKTQVTRILNEAIVTFEHLIATYGGHDMDEDNDWQDFCEAYEEIGDYKRGAAEIERLIEVARPEMTTLFCLQRLYDA